MIFQELQDALEDDSESFADLLKPGDFNLCDLGEDLPPPPPELLKPQSSPCGAKFLSQENLPIEKLEESDPTEHSLEIETTETPSPNGVSKSKNGFDTMPRASNHKTSQPIFMRRSSR